MSEVPIDYRDRLNLQAEIARIDRDRAEGQKLQEEVRKFVAEQHKFMAEAAKMERDRRFLPWTVVATLPGAGGALFAAGAAFVKLIGS